MEFYVLVDEDDVNVRPVDELLQAVLKLSQGSVCNTRSGRDLVLKVLNLYIKVAKLSCSR